MRTIHDEIFEITEIIKNGAIISGNDSIVNAFRQRCLEQAFKRLTEDVIPELISRNIMRDSQPVKVLFDRTPVEQKYAIRPELSPCPRLGMK